MKNTFHKELVFVRGRNFQPTAEAITRFFADEQARFAMAMIERWGMVSGKPDGEDSAGRSKLALMPVDELVERACDTAAAAFEEFEKRDWLKPCPTQEEVDRIVEEQENARENGRR